MARTLQERLLQLLKFFCCQHNLTWLRAYERQGVAHELSECMARGDGSCCLRVQAGGQ
jgi:hypothetical protein